MVTLSFIILLSAGRVHFSKVKTPEYINSLRTISSSICESEVMFLTEISFVSRSSFIISLNIIFSVSQQSCDAKHG